jgi:Tfp pilus assembly protein PilF
MATKTASFSGPLKLRSTTAIGLLLIAALFWAVQILRLRPTSVQQHLAAGRQYAQQGQARLAEKEWKAALQSDPKNTVALEMLAELYYSTENWQAAVPLYEQLITLKPDRPHTYSQLSTCLLRSGDEKASLNAAQEALKHDPNDATALLISAILLSKMGDLPQEQKYLERLLKLAPQNPFVLSLAAENRTYSHDYAAARPILERMLQINSANSEAYLLRGICDFDEDPSPQGLARAEAGFVQALKINPLIPLARLYLGKLYKRQGKTTQALFELEEAHRLAPSRADALFELAGTYEQARQPQKAAQARRQFETLHQEADLQASLEKKCAVYPDNFDAHLKLGLLFLKKQDAYKSGIFLRLAAKLHPNDAQAQEGLRKLAILQGDGAPSEADDVKAAAQTGLLR